MLNKLLFMLTDSLYPIRHPLDDYEDDLMGQQTQTITDKNVTKNYLNFCTNLVLKMCNGTLSEEEEKELVSDLNNELKGEYYDDKALNELISSFSEIIESAKSQLGLKQIRLRVVSDNNMPYRNSKPDCSYNQTKFPTEYYGYYDSYNAEIVLCPERISKAPAILKRNRCYITSRELYIVVLVHALAHALMDPTKTEEMSSHYQPLIRTTNGFSERDVLMEELLANMITLQYFDQLGKPELVRYGEVREWIDLQALPYRFGLDQYDILKPDWQAWRKAKGNSKFIK